MGKETITETVKLKIVCAENMPWSDLGAMLRALRAPLHRVINATIRELELAGGGPWWDKPTPRVYKKAESEPIVAAATGTDGDDTGGTSCSPRTASYRMVSHFWAEEREAARARVAKKKFYPGDEQIAEFEPTGGGLVLGLAGEAFSKWSTYDSPGKSAGGGKCAAAKWSGKTSLPSAKQGQPICIAGQGVKFYAHDGVAVLDVSLVTSGRTQLVVQACDGSGFARLRRLLDAPDRIGSVKLIEKKATGSVRVTDEKTAARKSCWLAYVSFSSPKPEQKSGLTMAVHRGVTKFLTVAVQRSAKGAMDAYATVLETGEDILKHKAAYAARRRSLGQQGRQLGAGAKGHGVDRRMERVTRLEDAEARWVLSKCQETAAHMVKLARAKGVGRLLLEDWNNPAQNGAPELGKRLEYLVRSFPMAQLRSCIEWAAKKEGLLVDIVPTDYNSRDCPACGHRHNAAHVGTFHCANPKCELERDVDVVFAWNMLLRDGKEPGVKEHNQKIKQTKKLIGGLTDSVSVDTLQT